MMKISPENVLKLISFWPPYLFAGIKVLKFDLDHGQVVVRLKSSWFNRNYFGTHFGGSLFAMCDPFYVFILAHKLGKNYIIWDQSSSISFVKATKEPVYATFEISNEKLHEIKDAAASGQKVLPKFSCVIKTSDGKIIANVEKILYVRKKNQ